MMARFLPVLMATCFLVSQPVFAQDVAEGAVQEESAAAEGNKEVKKLPPDYEERVTLSRKMHEIWPIRPRVERALDVLAERAPEHNRPAFKAAMRQAIEFQALEQASIDAMADIFTVAELKAMIEFYGSKEGRSIDHKKGDYERALQPPLSKMLDKAILDTKLGR